MKETEKFSIIKRAQSFTHAGRGIYIFIKSAHNAWVHLFIFALVIVMGFNFQITKTEWLAIIIVSGIVFAAEAFNSAIEIDMDLTSPDFHPYAMDTKDVAAGAVLISSIMALVVGIIVFLPYFTK
jgi:diacylglycerol kinase